MKVEANAEARAPVAEVRARLGDFAAIEAAARRAGVEVERVSEAPLAWRVGVDVLGTRREAVFRLVEDAPERMRSEGEAAGVRGGVLIVLARLGPSRTRIDLAVEAEPVSLKGRALLAPAKLALGTIGAKVQERLERFAASFGADAQPGGGASG